MKSLSEYINEGKSKEDRLNRVKFKAWWMYGDHPDVYEDYVNYLSSLIELNEYHYKRLSESSQIPDLVLENLQSHDYRKCIQEFKKFCCERFIDSEVRQSDESKFMNFGIQIDTDFYNSHKDKFENIANFFGYFKTREQEYVNSIWIEYEPYFTEDKTRTVYEKWNGILYHCVRVKSGANKEALLSNILRTGLRYKKNNYREYPERIFCVGCEKTNNLKDHIDNIIYNSLRTNPNNVIILINNFA